MHQQRRTYREDFRVPGVKQISGIGKTVAKGTTSAAGTVAKGTTGVAKTVAKGATSLPGKIMDKVFKPLWDWIKKAWGWLKFVVSAVCCLSVCSCCMSLGIPQMLANAVSR